jgi:hypothetical protein
MPPSEPIRCDGASRSSAVPHLHSVRALWRALRWTWTIEAKALDARKRRGRAWAGPRQIQRLDVANAGENPAARLRT